MLKLILAMLLVMSWASLACDSEGKYVVHGGIGCGEYLAQYEFDLQNRMPNTVTSEFGRTQGWILGYLTAYNAWAENGILDIQQDKSVDEVNQWLAGYCQANPSSELAKAMWGFTMVSYGKTQPALVWLRPR